MAESNALPVTNRIPLREARNFLTQRKVFPSRFKVLQDTSNCQEMVFSQTKEPWHNTNVSGSNIFYHGQNQAIEYLQKIWLKNSPNKYVYIQSYRQTCFNPNYFKISITPRSKKIVCDYAFTGYRTESWHSYQARLDEPSMLHWVHITYDLDNYHHVQNDSESWIAFSFSGKIFAFNAGKDFYTATVKIDESVASGNMICTFPWLHFGIFGRYGRPKWYLDFVERLKTFLDTHLKLISNHNKPIWKNVPFNIVAPSYMFRNSLLFTAIRSKSDVPYDVNSYIEKLIQIPPNIPDQGQKLLRRLALKMISRLLESGTIYFSSLYSMQIQKIINVLSGYITLVDDDLSLLDFLDIDELVKFFKFQSTINYIGISSDALYAVLKDGLFQKFPKEKRYRFLAEAISVGTNSDFHVIRDTNLMLSNIHRVQLGQEGLNLVADTVKTRQVKSWRDYHDKVIPVYNAIRFMPRPIDPEYFAFLKDIDLNIPDTNLKVVIPDQSNTIRQWGSIQNHCLGSYADRCASGQTLILGIWDGQTDEWYGHIQAGMVRTDYYQEKFQIHQFYGKRNVSLNGPQREAVIKYLDQAVQNYTTKLKEMVTYDG